MPAEGEGPDVVEMAGRLVAASSQNPGEDEREVARVVDELCAELGLPSPRRVGHEHRPNLILELPLGPSGPRLGLCGHLDTKPVGAGEWATDPLTAALVDDELRGRGVADMKGAIAAMLLAARDLVTDPPDRGRLTLILCADEEDAATFGAKLLAETAPPDVDAMVIGEPGGIQRDWDRVHVGSRGICNFDIDIATAQGHSSLRDLLGLVSATEAAAGVVVGLRERFRPPFPDGQPWRPTLNPGVVLEGGVTYGVLPGAAHVGSECRLVPGMTQSEFQMALQHFLGEHLPPEVTAKVTIRNWLPPATIDPQHPLAQAARRALGDVLGETPPDDLFPATTDATWFAGIGIATLPALGPGLIRHAHAANEAVSVAALQQARTLYASVARHFWEIAA